MGKQKTPNAELKARGSRAARNEVELTGGFGPAPKHLEGISLETWETVTRELESKNIGSSVERTALECYCLAVEEMHAARKDIKRLGRVVESERGFTRNPACLNFKAAVEIIKGFAIQFGLTPASRANLGQPVGREPENPMDEI